MKGEHGGKENLSHTLINIGLRGGLGTLMAQIIIIFTDVFGMLDVPTRPNENF